MGDTRFVIRALARGVVGAALISASVSASGADLLEIYHQAQSSDPTFDAARYALEAAAEKISQARAALLPSITVNAGDNVNHISSEFGQTDKDFRTGRDVRTWNWAFQLTQPLIRAPNLYAYRESVSLVDQALAQYHQAEQDLILRVTQAYFDVLVALESIDVVQAQLKAAEEQLAVAKRGYESGANAITDMHEAKSRADLARAQHIAAVNELNAKRAELEKLIGQPAQALNKLRPAITVPKLQPEDGRAWEEQARDNNPAVQESKAGLLAAQNAVSKNRAEHLPTLDFVASHGRNYTSGNVSQPVNYSTDTRTNEVGVQFSLPLFAGGATHSRVAEAIAVKKKAAADLEAARRQAGTDARQAYAGVVNGLAQIEALESALASSQSAVTGNQVGYKLGMRINIDVLNAEQQLYTTQRDLIKARYDTLLQGLKLKAAAGDLTEADVQGINGLLAPR